MKAVALSLVAIWFGVIWSFVAVMHGKARMQAGGLTRFWKLHLGLLGLIGLALDLVFNYTLGWLMFFEWPWSTGEALFSGRVQHHYRRADGWRYSLAAFWARQLNQMDPGHIRE